LGGHARADLFNKPTLEPLTSFESAATYDQGIGIERIYHLIEEKSQGMSLHAENVPAESIALIR
jgi:hypothetical protein